MKNKTRIIIFGFLFILVIFSLSANAFAASRSDLVINLGGKFVDHWTPDAAKSIGWLANYYTALPGESESGGMQVIVFDTGPNFAGTDSKTFYKQMKTSIITRGNFASFPAGDEAIYGKRSANTDYTDYLGRIGKYVVMIAVYDPKKKINAGGYFNDIIARLSGKSTGKYSELIGILKKYRPLLFKNIPDAIIVRALDEKRTNITGGAGPTINLEQDMMKEIKDFTKMLDTPLTGGSNSLVGGNRKTDDFTEQVWEVLKEIKDYLPEAAGKLVGVVDFFRQAHKKMVTVRDAYVLPNVAENLYSVYKSHRGTGVDESPQAVYDTWVAKAGSGLNLVRASDQYKNMSGDQFNTVFMQHLEARYQLEQYEKTRKEMLQNKEKIIEQIVRKYDEKINRVHSMCEELMNK